MAKALDLQEQEQVEEFKAFWKKWGNPLTWTLTAVLLAFAGWNGWGWYQRDQAAKAAVLFEQLDRAALAGDAERVGRVFNDLKDRYPRTAIAQQAGLVAARLQYEKGQIDAAKASLGWVAGNAKEDEYRVVANLRLAGVLMDSKAYDEALKALAATSSPAFAGLLADRRGDVLMALGKPDEAKAAFQAAYKALDASIDYRRLVEAKLIAMGAPPAATPSEGATK